MQCERSCCAAGGSDSDGVDLTTSFAWSLNVEYFPQENDDE